MENKYILFDLLNSEKNLTTNLSIALNESSCEEYYDLLFKMFEDISKLSKKLFTLGYNNSWYTLEETTKTKINTDLNKLNKELEGE